jgi:glycosyltransferase involved in cell wall biosynthesis
LGLSPAAGGIATSVPAVAHGTARSGLETHIVGLEDPEDPAAARLWGPHVHTHGPRPPRAFAYAPGLGATLTRLAPHLVDVQGLWTYPSLANLRHHRRTGTPYIVTPHGMLDPWARARSVWKKRLVRRWFEDEHLARAACLRATAAMEAEHLRSFGLRNPIAIVPNGVEIPPMLPAPPPAGPRRLLFLSRLHPKKGLPFLLRAWNALAPRRPDWELVIAGPDEVGHEAEMRALAARLGVPRVVWLPPVAGTEKDDLYRSADLFVLPTHGENFGHVIAEALSHGVPVVTTRSTPWSGVESSRSGWWIDQSDGALLDALDEATGLERMALSAMGARGRAWVERDFGWEGVVARMLDVYVWAAKGGTAPSFLHRD